MKESRTLNNEGLDFNSQVDVNSKVQDATQTPPLHLASISGNEFLVRSLFLAGVRINDMDGHRNTALHVAAKAGHAPIVSALLQVIFINWKIIVKFN